MYKRIIALAIVGPVCTEQGNAALMCKRRIILARKNSICEELDALSKEMQL